jgi:hypothetical protein
MPQSSGQGTDVAEALELVRQYLNGEIREQDLPEDVKELAKAAYAQKEAMRMLFLYQRYVQAEDRLVESYALSVSQQQKAQDFVRRLDEVRFSYSRLRGAERAIYRKLNQTLKDTRDIFARWHRGNESNLRNPPGVANRRALQETFKLELDSVLDWERSKGFLQTSLIEPRRNFHAFGRNAAGDVENWFRDSVAEVLDEGLKAGILPKSLKGSFKVGVVSMSFDLQLLDEATEEDYLAVERGESQLRFGQACYAFCVIGEVLKDIGDSMR